jgi:tetratricopeptide (TPR) repeat protein
MGTGNNRFFFPVSLKQTFFYSFITTHYSALLLLCLLPFLACACLTPKGSKSPAVRGLTAAEAARFGSQHDHPWQNPTPAGPEKAEAPENLTEMAEMFLHSGDYERSLENYSKILLKNPERHDIRYKLGVALYLSGNLTDAKKAFAEVLLQKMDMVEAHDALGIVYLQENNVAAAQREFQSALALEPGRFQSRYLAGEAYLRSRQYAQALPELKAALDLAPHNAGIMSALGWSCFKLKNYDQALQWLDKAKALAPQNPKIHSRLGMVLAEQKKFPEALAAFRKAGDEAQAYNNIGVYYYLEHRYTEAVRCFQKALDLRPTHYEEAKVNLEKALARLQGDQLAPSDRTDQRLQELSLHKK